VKLSATRWTIVQAAQSGDEEAIRTLCEKYRPALVSYMRRRGLGEEAEDVTQEALFGLVQSALIPKNEGQIVLRGQGTRVVITEEPFCLLQARPTMLLRLVVSTQPQEHVAKRKQVRGSTWVRVSEHESA